VQTLNPQYRKISIKKELADKIEEFIISNPGFGYRSLAEFFEDAARKRAEALGILTISKPRFEHYNLYEDHVTIMDNKENRLVDVYFRNNHAYCEYCRSFKCEHIKFIISLDDIMEKLRKFGWRAENGEIVRE